MAYFKIETLINVNQDQTKNPSFVPSGLGQKNLKNVLVETWTS